MEDVALQCDEVQADLLEGLDLAHQEGVALDNAEYIIWALKYG